MSNNVTRTGCSYKIRAMEIKDLSIIEKIQSISFSNFWSRAKLMDSLEVGYYCRVVEVDSEIIGYGVARESHSQEAEILNIFVVRIWQGMGIGYELMNHIVSFFINRGTAEIFLEVASSNTKAQGLYRKLNFIEVGRRPDYYSDKKGIKEDAVVMRLAL